MMYTILHLNIVLQTHVDITYTRNCVLVYDTILKHCVRNNRI